MRAGLFSLLLIGFASQIQAQDVLPPFWNEIAAFKTADSISKPAPGAILFIGSSSFRLWKNLDSSFVGYRIINRSFGGSTLLDQLRYYEDVVYPYQPRQVLIYCGENDFAASDTLQPATVMQRFIDLFKLIRKKYPTVPIAYVSMKPSPSRAHLLDKYQAGNAMIKTYLASQKRTKYVDVYGNMLEPDGSPMKNIFLSDNLHLNADGYAIWQKLIQPILTPEPVQKKLKR